MTSVSSSPSGPEIVTGSEPVFTESSRLQARLHDLVPGGAHTYARGSDQYPEHMAPVIERGRGARVWDVDGNAYVEYGMGLRAVTLGHAYEPVIDAVRGVLDRGPELLAPEPPRAGGRRGLPGHRVRRRHGEVRQERLRRDHRGAQARPRGHRARDGGRRRPAVLLHGRLVHRQHPDERRHPRLDPREHGRVRLQRPRFAARAVRRPPRAHRRGVHGGRDRAARARARLPRGRPRRCAPPRARCWCSTR